MVSRHAAPVSLDSTAASGAPATRVPVKKIAYHGWPDCFLLANDQVEAVAVPAIGRILQLRRAGDPEGVFWENRALDGQLDGQLAGRLDGRFAGQLAGQRTGQCAEELDGQLPDKSAPEWINFGGDKCWPAPQSAWREIQGRAWPPPVGFDARPMQATVTERGLALTSEIDPAYGIQVVRHVELDAVRPILRIRSEYRKPAGSAVRVAVWTVTQMPHPECVGVLLAAQSKLAGGYIRLIDEEPAELRIDGRLLLLGRHTRQQTKIGADGASLAWVGRNSVVRIDAEAGAETGAESSPNAGPEPKPARQPGPAEFPDGGCVTEVYTNPDPQPYVELETLGPLATLEAGQRIERTTIYTVLPRTTPDPAAEARKALS